MSWAVPFFSMEDYLVVTAQEESFLEGNIILPPPRSILSPSTGASLLARRSCGRTRPPFHLPDMMFFIIIIFFLIFVIFLVEDFFLVPPPTEVTTKNETFILKNKQLICTQFYGTSFYGTAKKWYSFVLGKLYVWMYTFQCVLWYHVDYCASTNGKVYDISIKHQKKGGVRVYFSGRLYSCREYYTLRV